MLWMIKDKFTVIFMELGYKAAPSLKYTEGSGMKWNCEYKTRALLSGSMFSIVLVHLVLGIFATFTGNSYSTLNFQKGFKK